LICRKGRKEGTDIGNKTFEGEALDTRKLLCGDHLDLELSLSRKHGVIPNGAEDYVGDGIKRPVAVASLEEAAVVARTQFMPWNARNRIEVQHMDFIQQQ
jgi:hypothetical protein